MNEQLKARVSAEVAALQGLNIDQLRQIWKERFGAPPSVRSGQVVRRCLAERIQIEAYGRDVELDGRIAELVRRYERTGRVGQGRKQLEVGTILLKEHRGATHRVEVTDTGLLWNGKPMASLTQIAKAITGTKWNGHAFFGVKTEPSAGR